MLLLLVVVVVVVMLLCVSGSLEAARPGLKVDMRMSADMISPFNVM